jgi:hypothetical protein
MGRPCDCDRDGCRRCWLARHDARYKRLWGVSGAPEPVPEGSGFKPSAGRFSLACTLRGEPTGETRPCRTCGGRLRDVPLYACPVHGVCSADGAPVEGVKWCRTCTDKVPPSPS